MPLLVLALLLAASLLSGCAHPTGPPPIERSVGPGAEAVMGAFEEAWNRQARARVRALFAPGRRALLDAHDEKVAEELSTWRVVGWRLDPLCHPRGDAFLLVRVQRRLRRPLLDDEPPREEVVWLEHDGEAWWLYSL